MSGDGWRTAAAVAQAIVAITLVASGFAKLATRKQFLISVGSYVRSDVAKRTVALSLPALEAALGLALASGAWPRLLSMLALVLFVGFALFSAYSVIRRIDAPCHCFGALSHARVGPSTLLRALLLAAMAGISAVLQTTPTTRDAHWSLIFLTVVSCACVGAAFGAAASTAGRVQAVLVSRAATVEEGS